MRFVVKEEFSARYAGPALDSHEMDAIYLGTALMGFGEIFREAQQLVAPLNDKEPRVKVKEVRPGSFEIAFGIDFTTIEQVANLLSGKYATAGANALAYGTLLLAVVIAAIESVKKKAAGKGVSHDELVNQLKDELLAKHVEELSSRRDFQKNVARLAEPVTEDGIDQVDFLDSSGRNILSIDEGEARSLLRYEEETEPEIRYEDATVEIGTPQIEKPAKRKWGLKHPVYGTINARLIDRDFTDQVDQGKVLFGKGRLFRARIRVEEIHLGNCEFRRDFEIVKIEPIEQPPQQQIEW